MKHDHSGTDGDLGEQATGRCKLERRGMDGRGQRFDSETLIIEFRVAWGVSGKNLCCWLKV
ncbi:MAG: hypothetical protein K8U57_35375 [Planctomycetes bacterium]|nr:hypothetical protein [Planctomycetota bacterium]